MYIISRKNNVFEIDLKIKYNLSVVYRIIIFNLLKHRSRAETMNVERSVVYFYVLDHASFAIELSYFI